MSIATAAFGAAATLYGIYMAWVRQNRPAQLKKLTVMKERLGDQAGFLVHLVGYTLVPVVAGLTFFIMGMRGNSIF